MNVIIISILTVFLFLKPAWAASKVRDIREGNALYTKEQYNEALNHYTEALKQAPDSDIVNFDLGTALYKNGDYEAAVEHLRTSLLGDDKVLQQKAHYNLGNTLYKSGMSQGKKDLKAAIQSLEGSLKEYEQALTLNKEDQDAAFNYEFVKKELERLKKKQQQQQNQKQNQEKNNQDQKQDDSQQQKEQKQSQQKDNQPSQESSKASTGKEGGEQKESSEVSKEQGKKEQPKPQSSQDQEEAGTGNQQKPQEGEGQEKHDSSASGNSQEMTKKEAQMRLNDYLQNDEPKGLLNLQQRTSQETPVLKDW